MTREFDLRRGEGVGVDGGAVGERAEGGAGWFARGRELWEEEQQGELEELHGAGGPGEPEGEGGFGALLEVGGSDAGSEFDDFEARWGDVEDTEVGDDAVDDGGAGEGECAGAEEFGRAVGGGVLRERRDAAADSGDAGRRLRPCL